MYKQDIKELLMDISMEDGEKMEIKTINKKIVNLQIKKNELNELLNFYNTKKKDYDTLSLFYGELINKTKDNITELDIEINYWQYVLENKI